jgi:hypothetical protein
VIYLDTSRERGEDVAVASFDDHFVRAARTLDLEIVALS